MFPYTNSQLGTTNPTLSKLEKFPQIKIFQKGPTEMHITQYPDLFATFCEGFHKTTGKKNTIVVDEVSLISPQPASSPLVFDSVKNTFPHRMIQIASLLLTVMLISKQ